MSLQGSDSRCVRRLLTGAPSPALLVSRSRSVLVSALPSAPRRRPRPVPPRDWPLRPRSASTALSIALVVARDAAAPALPEPRTKRPRPASQGQAIATANGVRFAPVGVARWRSIRSASSASPRRRRYKRCTVPQFRVGTTAHRDFVDITRQVREPVSARAHRPRAAHRRPSGNVLIGSSQGNGTRWSVGTSTSATSSMRTRAGSMSRSAPMRSRTVRTSASPLR
jgi:hypothetical protein